MKSPFDKIPRPLRPIAVRIGQRRLRTSHVAVAVTILMILGIISTAVFNFGVGVRPGPATGYYPEADAAERLTILTVTFWFIPALLGIFYALLANKLHTWLQYHARSRLNKPPSEFFRNHDLTKACGHAIEMILLDAADPVDADTLPRPLNPNTKKWLRENAMKAVAAWMDALSEDYKQESSEWERVWESEAFTWLEDRQLPALSNELWYTFLTRMNGWLTLPFDEDSEDATAIITRLNGRFGEAFWEVIKNDAAGDGYTAEALDLVVQAELLRRLTGMAATTDEMQKSLEAIKAEWEQHSAAVMKKLKEHGVKLDVVLRITTSLEVSLEKVQFTLDGMKKDVEVTRDKVEDIAADVSELKGLREDYRRLAEFVSRSHTDHESKDTIEAQVRARVAEIETKMRSEHEQEVADRNARIDRLTSGILALAGDEKTMEEIRRTGDGRRIVSALVALLESSPPKDEETLIQHHREILEWAFLIGEIDQAEQSAKVILDHRRNDLDAINRLGRLHYVRGARDKTRETYERLLELAKGDAYWEAIAYGNLALLLVYNEPDTAFEMYKGASNAFKRLDAPLKVATCLGNMGVIRRRQGRFDEAETLHLKALSMNACRRDAVCEANQHNGLGLILLELREWDKAAERFHRALRLWREMSNPRGIAIGLGNLGQAEMGRDNFIIARQHFEDSLEISDSKQHDFRSLTADQYRHLGTLEKAQGNLPRARELWTKSRDLFKGLDETVMAGEVQGLLDSLPAE